MQIFQKDTFALVQEHFHLQNKDEGSMILELLTFAKDHKAASRSIIAQLHS